MRYKQILTINKLWHAKNLSDMLPLQDTMMHEVLCFQIKVGRIEILKVLTKYNDQQSTLHTISKYIVKISWKWLPYLFYEKDFKKVFQNLLHKMSSKFRSLSKYFLNVSVHQSKTFHRRGNFKIVPNT